ncbi:hypothetical protein [Paenibacillus naphthalenovorans]|uniref:hypothetical protein n=1 Tax=Paenibacillus naphthalenovorans TaxID=162209 RepID=UPI003D2E3022
MIKGDLLKALDHLTSVISAQIIKTDTHHSVIIKGLNNDSTTVKAIATYIVSTVSNAIEANLQITADLMDSDYEDRLDLKESVLQYIGSSNMLEKSFIEKNRNPWIAEVILHLLLNISRQVVDIHPPGTIVAVGHAHDLPTDNGIDLAALYDGAAFGLTIAECKAYRQNPDLALSHATDYYVDFSRNYILGRRIRTQVQTMRASLPEELSHKATKSFWKNERCCMPIIFYDASVKRTWSRSRPSMNKIDVSIERRILVPIGIQSYNDFFDEISNAMRSYVEELLQNV